jgi:3-dehydroquinate synthase
VHIKSYRGDYIVEYLDTLKIEYNKNDICVVDKYIYENYLKDLYPDYIFYIVDSTENSKTLDGAKDLLDYMISFGFNKTNRLIAIGGGVVQDLVSFTSSILYRGIKWAFYPTTLLAQCDSCIGSKTSINYKGYKNLLGGFYPPQKIFIYKGFLQTLPTEEIKSGIGEMLHYFILNHKIDIAQKIVDDSDIINNIDYYTRESLSIKKSMIEKDEFDVGERNLFNYGHTFGHAIESISNYQINHGQAVTLGMRIANGISLKKGYITSLLYNKLEDILSKNSPDYKIPDIEQYIECLKKDKKNISEKLTCILINMEYAVREEVYYDQVREILNASI